MAAAADDGDARMFRAAGDGPCRLQAPDAEAEGLCLTPLNIRGAASQLDLSELRMGSTPARLLGGEHDEGVIYHAQPFDLADPIAMAGEDNLADDPSRQSWRRLSVDFAYMDVAVHLEGRDRPYWTVRYAFVSLPITQEPGLEDCLDEYTLMRSELDTQLVEGVFIRRGDVQVCRADSSDPCAPGEFEWLDLETSTFTSSRPETPYQLELFAAGTVHCEPAVGNGPPELGSLGGYRLPADLSTPLGLRARREGGSTTYTYTSEQGDVLEGSRLAVTTDFDASGLVFIAGVAATDEGDDAELLQALTLKPLYASLNGSEGDAHEAGMTASVTVELGEAPVAEHEGVPPESEG